MTGLIHDWIPCDSIFLLILNPGAHGMRLHGNVIDKNYLSMYANTSHLWEIPTFVVSVVRTLPILTRSVTKGAFWILTESHFHRHAPWRGLDPGVTKKK